jgi:hypothetical protein
MFRGLNHRAGRNGLILGLAAVIGLAGSHGAARAQPAIIAIGPPSFQTRTGWSLQDEVMYRLAIGQPASGDLERLSRLTLLQTIAMAATMNADLVAYPTPLGVRLEGPVVDMWNAADAFDQSAGLPAAEFARRSQIAQQLAGVQVPRAFEEDVNAPPPDFPGLASSLELLSGVQTAFSGLESDQAALSGASRRVGYHLGEIGGLIPPTTSQMDAVATELGFPIARPEMSQIDLNALRAVLRALRLDLAGVIRQTSEAKEPRPALPSLIDDLNDLVELVQGFDRLVSVQAPAPDLRASFLPVVRRMRQVEAKALSVDRRITLIRAWRLARDRIHGIAQTFELPRVIAPAAGERPARRQNAGLAARMDRAVAALDAYLEDMALRAGGPDAAAASPIQESVNLLRLNLLEYRQHLIAGDSNEQLAPRLRQIEQIYREVSDRAGSRGRVIRAAESPGRLRLDDVAAAIQAQSELLKNRR